MIGQREISLSVKGLVEFVLLSGDLSSEFTGKSRGIEGTRAHQKLQRSYGKGYTPEVSMKHVVEYRGLSFNIRGRADGIFSEEDNIVIDEIKSTTRDLSQEEGLDNRLHWGQVMCYGYFYCLQNNIDEIDLQLTYYNINTEEIKKYRRSLSHLELETFFMGLIEAYYYWAEVTRGWIIDRQESIKELGFPFDDYRKGQRELAVTVYRAIKEDKRLFAQAPTGTGKTMSTIFPSVKAMGEGLTDKIFYLTAKTITRQAAEEALARLRDRGLRLKSVTLTAKDKICFEKEAACTPEECTYAKGYFDRLRPAISDIFTNESAINREKIEEYAKRHQICPFEFSLELTLWGDCIICDYNYVFDPKVYLKRFFVDIQDKYTFLIDEAHNMVDRSREMFSAELYKSAFLKAKRSLKNSYPGVNKTLTKINTELLQLKKTTTDGVLLQQEPPHTLLNHLRRLVELLEPWLLENKQNKHYEEALELYFNALSFIKISEGYDEGYITYVNTEDKDVKVKLLCLDPSRLLSTAMGRATASILFSATLTPLDYFREILGGREEDSCLRLASPYSKDNLCLLVANSVSTKYSKRQAYYGIVADYIYEFIQGRQGNYLVFFPSHQYLRVLLEIMEERYPHVEILVQESQMTEEEREKYLSSFTKEVRNTVGFAVMGGIFSEGIDLVGDSLLGAIIIGVGLPQINFETDIIKSYFDNKSQLGYEYAYMFPGMNKVLQAAGRVIRTEKDRGAVLLIDERFTTAQYLRLFPKEWHHYRRINSISGLRHQLQGFWHK